MNLPHTDITIIILSLYSEPETPEAIDVSVVLPYPGASCESQADQDAFVEQFTSTMLNNSASLGCSSANKCTISEVNVRLQIPMH